MSCDQPKNSVSHSNTSWCSTFEVAVVDARFSDDLLSVSVKFDFSLNPSFFTTQFQDNICQKILGNQKYLLIGKNPICYVDPDDDKVRNNFIFYKKLIIKGGQNHTLHGFNGNGDLENFSFFINKFINVRISYSLPKSNKTVQYHTLYRVSKFFRFRDYINDQIVNQFKNFPLYFGFRNLIILLLKLLFRNSKLKKKLFQISNY